MSKLALFALGVLLAMPFGMEAQAAPTVNSRPTPDMTAMNVNPSDQDLMVAAFGTDVVITREYTDGQWHWNRRWANITANLGPDDGTWAVPLTPGGVSGNATIVRNDATYGRTSTGTANSFADLRFVAQGSGQNEFIEVSANTLTWKDRNGNWIDYELKQGLPNTGVIREYGNQLYSHKLLTDDLGRVTEVIDHFDNSLITFSYLDNTNLPTRIEDYSGRSVSYVYNDQRQLTEIVDVRGKSWHYTYTQGTNSKPKIASITDPRGNTTKYQYTNNSITKTDADGLDTVYTYRYDRGSDKTIRTEETPDGTIRKIVKDNTDKFGSTPKSQTFINGELISQRFGDQDDYEIENQAGERTRYQKNAFGKLERVVHPDQSEESWEYSADGRYTIAYVNRNGVRTEWDYDSYGRVSELREAAGLPEQATTLYQYPDTFTEIVTNLGDQYTGSVIVTRTLDEFGTISTYEDGEGHKTSYEHNPRGDVIKEVRPGNAIYKYSYDPSGNLLSIIDPLNNEARYQYDASGNLTLVRWPNDTSSEYRFNEINEQIAVVDAAGEVKEKVYDREATALIMTNELGYKSSIIMNELGLPALMQEQNGNEVVKEYVEGRLSKTTYSNFQQSYGYSSEKKLSTITDVLNGGSYTTYLVQDALGYVKELTDANGETMRQEYDAFGNTIKAISKNGETTRKVYDVHGNLVQVIDPEGNAIHFEYNKSGRVILESGGALGGSISYIYDERGNLESKVTPEGSVIDYTYNAADELVGIDFYDNEMRSQSIRTVQFQYYPTGLLQSFNDGEIGELYRYDERGKLIEVVSDFGPFTKTRKYEYDAAGRLVAYVTPENTRYSYDYDGAGNIKSIFEEGLGYITFDDYIRSKPQIIQYPGGAVTNFTYDGRLRLLSSNYVDPAQATKLVLEYKYDPVGNVSDKRNRQGLYEYNYDGAGQLLTVLFEGEEIETFSYDRTGNLIVNNNIEQIHNGIGQLIEKNGNTYRYDKSGNLVNRLVKGVATKFIYDESGRLVKVEDAGGKQIAAYRYDPFGRRAWKQVSGERTYFMYDDSGLAAEYDASGELVREYQYLSSDDWMKEPVFIKTSGEYYFYINSNIGAPVGIFSKSGEIVWEAVYDSYERKVVSDGFFDSPLAFPGQYVDLETNLYHNFLRDYDPSIGRYIQSDLVGLSGGLNPYSYADNNPIVQFDDEGKRARGNRNNNYRTSTNREIRRLREQKRQLERELARLKEQADQRQKDIDGVLHQIRKILDEIRQLEREEHPRFPMRCVQWMCPWDGLEEPICYFEEDETVEPTRRPINGCFCVREEPNWSGTL